MSENTPGPWRLDEAQRDVLALKTKRICEVPGGGVISTGVDKANARLIAAAPALVEALAGTVTELEKWWPGCLEHEEDACWPDALCLYCSGERAVADARAALALARGDAGRGR